MPNTTTASAEAFHCLSQEIILRTSRKPNTFRRKGFRAFFGITPEVCENVWLRVMPKIPQHGKPVHLLWALLLLKVYATESVNRALTGVDEKTFRKWAWTFINLMADMNVITWEKRYDNRRGMEMVSVDGSDFRIYEPYPFDAKWYSHKFHGPGLRYEVGVAIATGQIEWVNVPYPCGSHSDLKIFKLDMKKVLDSGEFVIADGGYSDERCRRIGENSSQSKLYSVIRARHETVNRRMKHFNILSNCFRHHLSLHSSCFHAVANLTELMIETSDPLFTIF